MRYLTEELYKKMQLFQLPLEDGITLDDLADSIEDADYPDFSDDTLATVRIDGQPISAYCF